MRRWRWAGVVATTGALVVAGCGGSSSPRATPGGGGGRSEAAVVLAAYRHTVGARTAAVSVTETVNAAQPTTITANGVLDLTSERGQLTLSVPGAGSFVMRLLAPDIYLQPTPGQASPLSSLLPAGKSWVMIDLDRLLQAKLGTSISQLVGSAEGPAQMLSYLQAVSTNGISRVGTETIHGVPTTEYAATVDLTKFAAGKSPQVQAAVQKLESELKTTTMPVHLWLDGQGRVVQVANQVPLPASGSAQATSVTSTIDFSDFSTPVNVVAPPASQVADITNQVVAAGSSG